MAQTTTNFAQMGFFLIKSLDSTKKQISQITPTDDGGIIAYKDASTAPIKVVNSLSSSLFCDGFIVVRNTKENVDVLIKNWENSLTYEKLVIIFLDEKTGNKWLLRPHIHAKVAEPKTLAQGLLTLFEHSMEKAK